MQSVIFVVYTVLTAIGLTLTIRQNSAGQRGLVYATSERDCEIDRRCGNDSVHDISASELHVPAYVTVDQAGIKHAYSNPVRLTSPIKAEQGTVIPAKTASGSDDMGVSPEMGMSTFTFADVSYYVDPNGTSQKLLAEVSGYIKPGQLIALMGVSGAGKTTLLDTLAQRKIEDRVTGSMHLGSMSTLNDPASFSRACGFCMQQDVHKPRARVREALEFSVRLRRSADTPVQDIETVVEGLIQQLEMVAIADALIGITGEWGLGVEDRKRVTIGVDLVVNSNNVLFLD